MSKKARIDKAAQFWLGSLKLPWKTEFLPHSVQDGYAGAELDIASAVKGEGGASKWKLQDRPTLVVVYAPGEKKHIAKLGELEQDSAFVAASRFFNLVRVDVASIKNKEVAARYDSKQGPWFLVWNAADELVGQLKEPKSSEEVLDPMKRAIHGDFDRDATHAIADMARIVARMTWIEDAIKKNDPQVICADCGDKNTKIAEKLKELREELADLKSREIELLGRPAADGTAKRKAS